MELTFRAAAPAERLYIAKQSTQIEGQTGSVGHLQADMGEDGKGFFPKWTSHRESLDTEDFQQEFEEVLEALVGDEQYGGFLKSRDAMRDFCRGHQESGYDSGFAFGFRADTAQYAYLIRLHPYKGEENLFLYCYRRDWLDRHMEQAEKGIRFIDPHYKELFRIPDGGQIRILREGCAPIDRTCRYIDDCHVEVGNGWDSLFHICQFAEQMERCHNEVIPLTPPLLQKPRRLFQNAECGRHQPDGGPEVQRPLYEMPLSGRADRGPGRCVRHRHPHLQHHGGTIYHAEVFAVPRPGRTRPAQF